MDKLSTNVSFLQSTIPAVITALITIIGFIVTYSLTRKTFIEEAKKQKLSLFLEKLEPLPMEIQVLLDDILEQKDQASYLARFKKLISQVFAYGSENAIKLIANMQEINYRMINSPSSIDPNRVAAYFVLAICQIKYDITGVEINPQYWYRMRLKDYAKMKETLDKANNEIVKELELQSFMEIAK